MANHDSAVDPRAVKSLVQEQFAPSAQAYVTSATHAHGADLAHLLELAEPNGSELVLDVATGGGHTALIFAPHVRHVIASDLTFAMLQAARTHIEAQSVHNISYLRAEAEQLPCEANSIDILTCRIAAHHFANIQDFVRSAAIALRPGGMLLVSDHIGLEDAEADAFMDRFERWRDPSHVRAYSYTEWQGLCTEAGLEVIYTEDDPREPYEFESWTARMRMNADDKAALETWLIAAPAHLRERFEVQITDNRVTSLRGTFGIIVAQKPKQM